MKTDRELTELAAKAAGIKGVWHEDWKCLSLVDKPIIHEFANFRNVWAPLDDDGDALRLAVKLRLVVWTPSTAIQSRALAASQDLRKGVSENCGDEQIDIADPFAATRRAIVRAAAAIGEAMP